MNKVKPLERFTRDIQWEGNFNAPEAFHDYYFVDRHCGIIGDLSGGMSPLHDTFYLFKLEVPLKHRCGNYELSMLANIAQLYGVPITPMHAIDSRLLERLRKVVRGHVDLRAQLSADQMVAEILRWSGSMKVPENSPSRVGISKVVGILKRLPNLPTD
jgi:hypothetical protein